MSERGRRLFLALDPSEPARAALGAYLREARLDERGWRVVAPSNLHLTLRFIGATAEERLAPLERALEELAPRHPSLALELGGLGVFPSPRRPRVLWAGVEEPAGDVGGRGGLRALATLAAGLEEALRGLGFAPEERPFRAHLTLARAKGRARMPEPGEGGGPRFGSLEGAHFRLVESHLLPEGPRYETLASYLLGGGSA